MKRAIAIVSGVTGILLVVFGLVMKGKENSVMIIGGADGPTSIFVAGKTGGIFPALVIVTGIVLIVAGILAFLRKKNRL